MADERTREQQQRQDAATLRRLERQARRLLAAIGGADVDGAGFQAALGHVSLAVDELTHAAAQATARTARCPVCGGFYGDSGRCVTVGCEGGD